MIRNSYWVLVFIFLLAPSLVSAGGIVIQNVDDVKRATGIAALQDGYYLRAEFVDVRRGTYSISRVWDAPPIFAEFSVKRGNGGYQFEGGNLHESLVSFALTKSGHIEGQSCFENFCIKTLKIKDSTHFSIIVNGIRQEFVLTKGLKQVEEAGSE